MDLTPEQLREDLEHLKQLVRERPPDGEAPLATMDERYKDVFESLIEVTLTYEARAVRHLMFLDSGADISLIPASLGQALGLCPTEHPLSAAVRSLTPERTSLRIVELQLQIGSTTPVPVRFGWGESDEFSLLLECLDLFEHFKFEFNHQQRLVIVRQ